MSVRCGLYLPRFALRTAVRFASAGLGRYQLFYSIINKVRDLVFSYTGPVILVKNHCESLQERSSRRSNLCVEKFDNYFRNVCIFCHLSNFSDVKIIMESLPTPNVTLGAFAKLSFRLNTSMIPNKKQLSVRGPSGTELAPTDFRFSSNGSSLWHLEFVVAKAGSYRVTFFDPRASAMHRGVQIKTKGSC